MQPNEFFEGVIVNNKSTLKRLKRNSLMLSMSRLLVFLGVVLLIYFFWGNNIIVASTFFVGIGLFLFLVNVYTDLKLKKSYHEQLEKINKDELSVLKGDLSHLETGKEFIGDEHYFNQDIDLFGDGSIFQLINRTSTKAGRQKLADNLNSNDVENVADKQQAVEELNSKVEWRQHYKVTADLIEDEVEPKTVINWMSNYQSQMLSIFRYVPVLFSIISAVLIVIYGMGLISGVWLGIWFFIGLQLTGFNLKKINGLYKVTAKLRGTFEQYAKLILAIENQNFNSIYLKQWKAKLESEGIQTSERLQALSKDISSLDQRNNIFFALIANGFFLWDLRFTYKIEKWVKDNRDMTKEWFEVIAFFDSMNSLANYAFIRPTHIYPLISNSPNEILSSTQLGHPLLDPSKRVDNSVSIMKGDFFIITGANMAGKSTFLRTVALNLVMANCGLPVCAQSFTYTPIKLISSMRTSDSLKDDESYFFSELKRLKFIVNEIQKDSYFIILDEILKGTNSKDKAEGSKKFVKRLVSSKSTGLIATHDLSLCTLSDDYEEVKNCYFEAEIIKDELSFDYKLKEGICKNMNASFLLKKMEIV